MNSHDNDQINATDYCFQSYEQKMAKKKRKKLICKSCVFGVAIVGLTVIVATFIRSGASADGIVSKLSGMTDDFLGSQAEQVEGNFSLSSNSQDTSDMPMVVVTDVSDMVERARASVVGIVTESYSRYEASGSGSGIIMTDDGYIVTNQHVIEDGDSITVNLDNGESYSAYLVGEDSFTDIAVLKIEAQELPYAILGNSDELRAGEAAIAIGNPTGMLMGTVTAGIISAVDRNIEVDGNQMTFIQTDAAINSGNSGGPLLNSQGQVVGVNTIKISAEEYEGLGFAIPINSVIPIVEQLINQGYISGRPFVGLNVNTISQMAAAFNRVPMGLYVTAVDENSSAYKIGIREGDIITAVGDVKVIDIESACSARNDYAVGETVELTIYRSGQYYNAEIVLSENNGDTDGYNF